MKKIFLMILVCSFLYPQIALADLSNEKLPKLIDPKLEEKTLEGDTIAEGKNNSMSVNEKLEVKNNSKPVDEKSEVKKEDAIKEQIKNEYLDTVKENPSDTVVLIKTSYGPIKIKLFTKEAPKTTENFIDLVKKGFYNGTIFHRVVKGFVLQGGDPLGNGTGNYVDKETGNARYIPLEINAALKWDKVGRVGMARSSNPNSASCQFFIALDSLPSLNPGGVDPYGYAIFGQVTEDSIPTIKKIEQESKPSVPGGETPVNPVKMESVSLL